MTAWWGWLLVGAAAGSVVTLLLGREFSLYRRVSRRGTVDLTGARPRNRGANS